MISCWFRYTVLNLNGYLYIGGLPEELREETPPQAWSARLREDFVGCLSALSIDGESLDLGLETTARWAKGYVRLGESDLKRLGEMCPAQKNPCSPGKCMQSSWSEPLCDCTQTNVVGSQCKEGTCFIFILFMFLRIAISMLAQISRKFRYDWEVRYYND